MSTTHKYILAVDIQTLSPMHITAIEKGAYDAKSGRLSRYDGAGVGTSLTRTLTLLPGSRVTDAGAMVSSMVPVIPSSTVGGKVRRAAADLICNSLIKRGLTISPDAFNVLTSGMANNELKADEKTPEVLQAARKDAFLSVFGGTSFALSAHSVIADGMPILVSTKDNLMSKPIVEPQPFAELREMTEVLPIIRKNDAAAMEGTALEQVVGFEALVKYSENEANQRATSKASKDAKEEGKKTDLRTLNGIETVRTGLMIALRIEVTSFHPAHLGLMLLSLQSFLCDGQVGGKVARGFGRFTAVASNLLEVDPQTRQMTPITTIYGDKDAGYPLGDNPVIADALVAAQDYLDSVTPELLEAFTKADAKAIKQIYKEAA